MLSAVSAWSYSRLLNLAWANIKKKIVIIWITIGCSLEKKKNPGFCNLQALTCFQVKAQISSRTQFCATLIMFIDTKHDQGLFILNMVEPVGDAGAVYVSIRRIIFKRKFSHQTNSVSLKHSLLFSAIIYYTTYFYIHIWNDVITVRTKHLWGIVSCQWKYTCSLWM